MILTYRNTTELEFTVKTWWHNIPDSLEMSETDFKIGLHKLSRAGLINEVVGTYVGYSGGHYLITSAFKRFMNFIRYSKEPVFNYNVEQQLKK